jgi:hypothetical protein
MTPESPSNNPLTDGHFIGAIPNLLARIDPLISEVAECVKVASGFNESDRQHKQTLAEFDATPPDQIDKISAYKRDLENQEAELSQMYRRLQKASGAVREFVEAVIDLLDYCPTEPPHLGRIREEIERLALLTAVTSIELFPIGSLFPMKHVHVELPKLRHRLNEFLRAGSRDQPARDADSVSRAGQGADDPGAGDSAVASALIAEPAEHVRSPHVTQKNRRGRPAKIPDDRKAAALEVFKASKKGLRTREAAKVLYQTKDPTKTQRANVSSTLKGFSKRHGLEWPLLNLSAE